MGRGDKYLLSPDRASKTDQRTIPSPTWQANEFSGFIRQVCVKGYLKGRGGPQSTPCVEPYRIMDDNLVEAHH